MAKAAVAPPAVIKEGQIVYCSDISAPPLEFYDAARKPQGADIEIGDAIARKLGVQPVWRHTKFASIIPTLVARQCDAILSQLYIKPEREEVVDFVPYMYSGQSILVPKGNPKRVGGLDETLCGLAVSTLISTTAASRIDEQSKKCEQAGRPAIKITRFDQDIAALQELALGRSDAYATTSETAAYYMGQQKETYEFAGAAFDKVKAGIAVRKGNTGLHDAITKAFEQIRSEGTYDQILAKWNLQVDKL
ncbi:ABC transporter substrate-binding protein [Nonomuraea aridisoli]|uniref:ABC transporter substrate-binding protein n=1 Tax=Nonomuraea aridisoli TaxID=2070368 RepID=UPI0015E882F4|nr:ABC transporter substrate-binding protein [Nonomuraea aridisoli]